MEKLSMMEIMRKKIENGETPNFEDVMKEFHKTNNNLEFVCSNETSSRKEMIFKMGDIEQ